MPATKQYFIAPPVTLPCSAAVSANRLLMHDASNPGQVKHSTAAHRAFVGVSDQASAGSGTLSVQVHVAPGSIVKVIAGSGGVTAGDAIASDATGQGVTFTDAGTGTAVKTIAGRALSTAAAGELFSMLILPLTGLA